MSEGIAPLSSTASLYVVATPLGNLQDISPRAVAVLGAVAAVAAEDTRHSQRLLDAFGIRARLIALHEHNEQSAAGQVLRLLEEGGSVALISDAGTPAVSDPGARAVARVRAAGFPVVAVPGPCAAVAALSISGLGERGFRFVGFLPPKRAARRTAIEALRGDPDALVFYEAPHRVRATVASLAQALGADRAFVVAREITKTFESIASMKLGEADAWFAGDANRERGEFVLVVDAPHEVAGERSVSRDAAAWLDALVRELPPSRAARIVIARSTRSASRPVGP